MRIWDIEPKKLCRNHLLGEHREFHAIWNILNKHKKGYANHPETKRWKGKLKALYCRHENIVKEMKGRGFRHKSNLDVNLACGCRRQAKYVDSIQKQKKILKAKKCDCVV